MFNFFKNHFKFVFTICWATFLFFQLTSFLNTKFNHLEKINELNFNYTVFRVDCLNKDLDSWEIFKEYLKKTEETNSR